MSKKFPSPLLLLYGAAVVFALAFFLGRASRGDALSIETQRRAQEFYAQTTAADDTLTDYIARRTETAADFVQTLDLNRATCEQLQTLPGVGEKTAQAIVDYRSRYGRFVCVRQLLDVDGIGEALLGELCDLVYVDTTGGYE